MVTLKYNLLEMMVITACKEFRDGEIAFVGIGLPMLAGILATKLHAPNLTIVYESGCVGTRMYRVDFNVGDSSAADEAVYLTSMWRIFGDLQAGCIDLGILGGAQIDRYGNLNTTAIFGDGNYDRPLVRLPGSGGGNDIGSSAGRTVIIMRLEKQRFPEKIDYVTTPGYLDGSPGARRRAGLTGNGPQAVITDKAVFRFDEDSREMYLDTIYPGVTVAEITETVGWNLKVKERLKEASSPTPQEMAALRFSDPANLITGGKEARKKLSGIDEYVELTINAAGQVRPR